MPCAREITIIIARYITIIIPRDLITIIPRISVVCRASLSAVQEPRGAGAWERAFPSGQSPASPVLAPRHAGLPVGLPAGLPVPPTVMPSAVALREEQQLHAAIEASLRDVGWWTASFVVAIYRYCVDYVCLSMVTVSYPRAVQQQCLRVQHHRPASARPVRGLLAYGASS